MIDEMIDAKMTDQKEKNFPTEMIDSKMIDREAKYLFLKDKMIDHFGGKLL